jgi:phosphate transport system protein
MTTTSEHIYKQYDSDLEGVRTRILQMGGLAERQIVSAMKGYVDGDASALDEVLVGERALNRLEIAIDEDCAHIIARRQPAARDLRLVLSITKVVTDLERIGDEAEKIARMGRQIHERQPSALPRLTAVGQAGNHVTGMLRDALDAYARLDSAAASRIIQEDRQVDSEFRAILRQLVTYMMEDPRTISTALDVVWIAKAIERIGDHAKNIAEYVIYIAEGTDVRHSSDKPEVSG